MPIPTATAVAAVVFGFSAAHSWASAADWRAAADTASAASAQVEVVVVLLVESFIVLYSSYVVPADRLARLGHTPHPQGIPPDFSVATDFETEVGVGLLFGRGGWLRSTDTEKS